MAGMLGTPGIDCHQQVTGELSTGDARKAAEKRGQVSRLEYSRLVPVIEGS